MTITVLQSRTRAGRLSFATRALLLADTRGYETFSTGQKMGVAKGTTFEVAASGAVDQHETTAGGVKLYESGTFFTTLQRFKDAVARGDAYEEGDGVLAGGETYYFADDGNTDISGLTGWSVQLPPALRREFDTVALLLDDTRLTYTASLLYSVSAGDIVKAGGYRYEVAASGASDQDVTTAGGVNLYVILDGLSEIHAEAFGLTAVITDQFSAFNRAVQACSPAECAINIEGLDIRFATQANFDDVYVDVSSASNAPYAILIPSGGFMKIVGGGSISPIDTDSRMTLFHAVDSRYVEIGDDVTLDGRHSKVTRGTVLHLMGVERLHLGRCTITRNDIVRFGASELDRSGILTFTQPRFIDCWGTHCIGGKPGGFKEIYGDTLYFENCMGALNCETEDVNGVRVGSDTAIYGHINQIIAVDMDGDKDPAFGVVTADAFFVSDSLGADISVGSITMINSTPGNGNSGALTVGAGQDNLPPARVSVGSIYVENTLQAMRFEPSTVNGNTVIEVGSISGVGLKQIIKGTEFPGIAATPAPYRLIHVGSIDVTDCEVAFWIDNNNGTYPGDILDALMIDRCNIDTCDFSAGYVEDVRRVEFGDYGYSDVVASQAGQPWVTFGFYVDVSEFIVRDRLFHGGSHNQAMQVTVSSLMDIRGLDIVNTDAGGGLNLSGGGNAILRDGGVRATGGGTGLQDQSFTGSIELRSFNVNGTGIDSGLYDNITVVHNSDFLSATNSAWAPGSVAGNTAATTTQEISGARAGDTFTVAPTTFIANLTSFDISAVVSSNNTLTLRAYNQTAGALTPGTGDYTIIGSRGT